MRLLITRRMTPVVLAAASARFEVTLRDDPAPMDSAACAAALRDYPLILPTLGDAFGAAAFSAAAGAIRTELLANFGVGYNHIDVEAARAHGIAVTNTPGAVTDATADIAVMLMLMSARRASEGERILRAGRWTGWLPTQLLGLHMTGKTVGIVGLGRIGKAIARRCHFGFGMTVIAHSRSAPQGLDHPVTVMPDLPALMAAADFVVLAVPASPATRHLIGAAELAAMQPHAHLINIARGDIVDEAALIDALRAGRIGGAGLDVYEREPEVPEALRTLDNVTLLPHLGTATEEVRTAMGMMALDNLIAHVEGRQPPNLL